MPAIEIEALTRDYGRRRGIRDVDLTVPEGSVFGFLGPNGAGKTTTIRVLLDRPVHTLSEGNKQKPALVFGATVVAFRARDLVR